MSRKAKTSRKTKETNTSVELNIDGKGKYKIDTGIGFLDHMLEQFSKHSSIDLNVKAKGDTHIDLHHTTEDTGIAIGECLKKASGCKVVDETKDGGYITPVESSGDFVTYISRIRDDQTQKNSINMWVVSDNLLKGAALNAVQIANVLIKKYIK